MNPTRREALLGLAGVCIAPLALCEEARTVPADETNSLIIDTHQHLWDLSKFKIPWLDNAPEIYRHNYRPQEYAQATRNLNVRSVYMEVDVSPEQRGAEAEYVIDLCRTKTGAMRAAVIGGRPNSPGFEAYIKNYCESGFIRGVRQVLQGDSAPAGTCLSDDFLKSMRLLGRLGLSYDLCMSPVELKNAVKLAELTPDTRYVLDHCGNADPRAFLPADQRDKASHDAEAWKRDMDALARRANVICKISGIVAGAPEKWTPGDLKPIVDHCLDTFGPDRVVFGGDWPVCLKRARLIEWVDALKQIVARRPESERIKLWSANAMKFYSISA